MVERIKMIIEHYEMTDRSFALTCGLKPNTFCNQLNGKREVSLTTISAILDAFQDVSADWMLRNKGNMLVSATNMESNERLSSLVDTIATLTSVLKTKDARIKELEMELEKLKKK